MRFATVLPFVFSGLGLVRAIDDRLLYTIPSRDTIAIFTTAFQSTCESWPAAAGLKFEEALVEPGDFSGANDTTEAKLLCYFADAATGTFPEFTADVAASLGATPV
ncbi:hypothetical protein C8R44DRAFT_988831 [Mycena epipterygia]|nr:hypothetical protein C8R44DRAFT_988831 [Mycena epipterygia]